MAELKSTLITGTLRVTEDLTAPNIAYSNHTHAVNLAASGSSGTTLAADTWYTLTVGGSTVTFKTPADVVGETGSNGTVTSVSAGVGLVTSDGNAISSSGTIKAKLKSETANSGASTQSTSSDGGLYAVEVDKDGYLAVRVPWKNTQDGQGVTSVTAGFGLNTTSGDTTSDGGSITTTGTLYLTKVFTSPGSFGPSDNATPSYGETFSVPYITVDKAGRITAAATKTITLPSSDNTNTSHSHSDGLGLVRTGDGGTSGDVSYKVALVNETKNSSSSTQSTASTGGLYAIELDKDGKLAVRVPWTDNNTWREIQVGGTQKIASNASTALNFVSQNTNNGDVSFTYDNGIKATAKLPTIPATNVIPAESTANKILTSTSTSGTAAWSTTTSFGKAATAAGFLKIAANGTVSVDTTAYTTNTGTITGVSTSGTGISGSGTSGSVTITLKSSSDGNANSTNYPVVLRNANGSIQTEKVAISSGTTTKATIQYDTTDDCVKFIFS